MADRIQNRLQASASMASSGGQGETEIPMANEADDRSVPVQPPRVQRRVCPSCMVEEEEDVTPLNEVDSDSDSGSTEDDDYVDSGSEEDEGADGVAEEQHQNQASTPAGQANPDAGLLSSTAVTAALNHASGRITVTLTDPDVLDCPICLDPLRSPIYQCENGHIACSSCSIKLNHKCPSCCLPIGFNRCRAMENLIESVRIDCKNKESGCTEPLIYYKKSDHEQTCPYTLCFCPLSSCGFTSSSKNLYNHFRTYHPSSATSFTFNSTFTLAVRRGQKHMILQEQNEGVIFILNHETQEHGRIFNVDCLGPNSFKRGFVYQLSVRCLETCFSVKCVPEVCAKWEQHTPNKNRLTIPSEFLRFIIEVCIKKAHT